MLALDLFAGAGLVADGLREAGCTVVGVDNVRQPNYPGAFLLHDALTLDPRFIAMFDFIWASPPCLRDTVMKHAPGAKGDDHEDLITPTRAMLRRSGKPYVMENVETAPLLSPTILCASMFDLGVDVAGQRYHLQRHRKFETNWPLRAPCGCLHRKPVVGVYGAHARVRAASAGGRGTADFVGQSHRDVMGKAMGIPADRTVTCAEISQGIPPSYSKYVALQLMQHLKGSAP